MLGAAGKRKQEAGHGMSGAASKRKQEAGHGMLGAASKRCCGVAGRENKRIVSKNQSLQLCAKE